MAVPIAPAAPVNATEVGKVIATLNDFQLILYVLVVVIIVLVAERLWVGWSMRKERETMWKVADKFGEAADKLGEQTNKLVTELQVLRALASRVESIHSERG